ncbi:glycerol kinase GlpK [Methylobacterium nodulans]|uniref:Glycerol kinase n=1 Tax=Methylobacterium nodulans (strain LMG 21967 / CNCM I-2342 / ORS 2060) TaxID=460265 RepID=GLPK_METNO|nr:glycerol kinase GlpK [Methylobacterium nodulans]B8IKN3.1 RecName: Full=Glycerol kinase; AltName: Full=ATP:glycerol 3-phosphotransferase; AltName: Full=Glycerokinase; Short=GK [Methylobacterium nodulans ORS 2060]ACL56240.1 glycerol kinase [Methylobacterium nodulans ORS 2060]
MTRLILAIDQGTTSTRALLFRPDTRIAALAQAEFPQHFPASGWVEHEPEDLWRSTLDTCRAALRQAGAGAREVAAIGITNQRETTLIWDRRTGEAVHRAIVWQDRRTAGLCARLKEQGHEPLVSERTGLLLDPYFAGTKIAWILDQVPGARARADAGELAFGTVDSYLLWRLTGGRVHVTDATNASRTLLFDIHRGAWDDDLLRLFDIPRSLLPEVRDSSGDFGTTDPDLFGAPIPIRGVAGDQQAATVGQACFRPGMVKSTYGTGCFALLNTGPQPVASRNKLLTTIAYQLGGERTYALEGSIFVAGAAVQWLRDGLGVVASAAETGDLAERADPAQEVYLVPAFVGLGAPYWEPDVRGALYGLTRGTRPAELARAALESVCYQTADLLAAMRADWPDGDGSGTVLRVDGGMVASDWTMQRLADLLAAPVDRPEVKETTALGAAYLAGLACGLYPEPERFADHWRLERRFTPAMDGPVRERKLAGWRKAVGCLLGRPVPLP